MDRTTPSKDIIIVDDDVVMIFALEELLAENGYQVAGSAGTGEEALEMARKHHPALVLMDIKLGEGLDGIQTARILHEELGIFCIFITGYNDHDLIERAKRCRPLGYILKPLNEKQLLTDVEMAIFEAHKRREEQDLLDEAFPHNKLVPKDIDLTPAEIRVAFHIKRGKSSKEIAEILSISNATVEWHRKNIRKKLQLTNTKKNLTNCLLS